MKPAKSQSSDINKPQRENNDDNAVERIAKKIDPPGTEATNQDIKNPGEMTPDATPVNNRS